ncbi:MAG: hypothetical protein ACMXYA_01955 [Candidatus Woesearchaeota archaeon]
MENEKMPIYVKITDYEKVLETVTDVKHKLQEAKSLLSQITELKHQEDAELQSWTDGLQDVEERLLHFDEVLFKPNSQE